MFEGQSVSGLIDHAAIKIDHVVADVARLIGSLGHVDIASLSGPDGDVLAAYEAACPLQANELALVDALLATGPAVQLTQWARWLLVERRTFPDCGAVSRRLAFLVEQGRKCLERAKLVH